MLFSILIRGLFENRGNPNGLFAMQMICSNLYGVNANMEVDLKNRPIYIGVRQCSEAVSDGKAERAYVARDADAHVREPFEALCKQMLVPVAYFDTKQQLGRACGIDVGAACAVVFI